jgi:hypothetical protein
MVIRLDLSAGMYPDPIRRVCFEISADRWFDLAIGLRTE